MEKTENKLPPEKFTAFLKRRTCANWVMPILADNFDRFWSHVVVAGLSLCRHRLPDPGQARRAGHQGMILAALAVLCGLVMLVWSADRFVDGAARTASYFKVPPMLVVGFGTSAPELMVSALSAIQNNPGIALGNAYGSNITNIALILGITALISPITVLQQVLRKELLVLTLVTGLAVWQLWDGQLTRVDAIVLLVLLAALVGWTVRAEQKAHLQAASATEEGATVPSLDDEDAAPIRPILFWLIIDLALLVISSRVLVWGAVEIAHGFGVSDLIIGLTIVAVGTSLPELASSVAAARKGEDDLALGNVIGSNLFNTLGVVGLAAVIQPMSVETQLLSRDIPVMCVLTLALFVLGYNFGKSRPGRINRLEGCLLLAGYIGYTVWLIESTFIRGAA